MWGRSRGRKASWKFRNRPCNNLAILVLFTPFKLSQSVKKKNKPSDAVQSHLEQAEPAGAELVLALAILQRQELDELVDEHWV